MKNTSKAKEYQKRLLKVENEIIRGNKLFCVTHDIVWTKTHDTILRNAMRVFFEEGINPIMNEIFDYPPNKK